MLHDLDKTLEKILIERGKFNKGEIDITFEQPTSEWSATLSRPTINCWGFDLRENIKLRTMERDIQRQMSKKQNVANIRRVPMRFDISYLVTAWARKAEDEHQLLWRALAALAHYLALDPADCEGSMQEQPYDIPLLVGQMTEAASNMTDLWSVLDNEMRMGFTVVATLALDPQRVVEAPLVLEGRLRFGQAHEPEKEEITYPEIYGEDQAKLYADGIPIKSNGQPEEGKEG